MSVSDLSAARLDHRAEREDLAAAFRWAARLNLHEAVANHFSLAVDDAGRRFLINPNQRHFSLISASDLLLLDGEDRETLDRPDAPDATAWGLHGAIHRRCPHHRCALHVHATHATILAALADSRLPPVDQNAAMFFRRHVVDNGYGGLAFEAEGERCAALLADPRIKILVMGNHGVTAFGETVAEAFNALYYFERAAETYVKALWTGRPLRILPDDVAEKTAQDLDVENKASCHRFFADLKTILDREEPDYRD